MEESGAPDCKRRRTTDIAQSITQLPHDYLSAIAEYLPQISRGLLAVALTAPSASFHTTTGGWNGELSDAGKAIISVKGPSPYTIISLDRSSVEGKKRMEEIQKARWEILDFSDIDELAGKLSDDDIGALLVSIEAKKKLKVLRMDYCCNIVGHGLQPLVESLVFESINLYDGEKYQKRFNPESEYMNNEDSCYRYRYTYKRGKIDVGIISLLLNSMVNLNLLEFVRMNKHLNLGFFHNREFILILLKIKQLLLSKEKCEICEENYYEQDDDELVACDHVCLFCFTCMCNDCNDCDYDGESNLHQIKRCGKCELTFCRRCEDFAECSECESIYCYSCSQDEDVDAAVSCDDCKNLSNDMGFPLCIGCRSYPSQYACRECLALSYPRLVSKIMKLTDEYEQVKDEKDKVVGENEQLHKEVEELSKKLSSGLIC